MQLSSISSSPAAGRRFFNETRNQRKDLQGPWPLWVLYKGTKAARDPSVTRGTSVQRSKSPRVCARSSVSTRSRTLGSTRTRPLAVFCAAETLYLALRKMQLRHRALCVVPTCNGCRVCDGCGVSGCKVSACQGARCQRVRVRRVRRVRGVRVQGVSVSGCTKEPKQPETPV